MIRRPAAPAPFVAALFVAVVVAGVAFASTDVAAAGDAGARSTVVGRGDIVTSILGWGRGGGRGGSGTAPRCSWRTLTDIQLEWLVAVAGQSVALGRTTPLLDPLRPYLDGAELPDGDLLAYVCGTSTYELRFVERTEPRSAVEVLVRSMITRLPVPDPTITPPIDAVVPVGQPVFVSIPATGWSPVRSTLSAGGLTAQVEAEPTLLRIITGDPAVRTRTCDGPGRPFRQSAGSAAAQARGPDACVVVHRTASAGHRAPGSTGGANRPDLWLGTVTVVWDARWRIGDGPWQELGSIPRTRLVARATRDLTTSLETIDRD